VILLCLLISGVHIAVFGQTEALRWVYDLHIITAYATLALITMHLFLHVVLLTERQKQSRDGIFTTISQQTLKATTTGIVATIVFVAIFSAGYSLLPSPYVDEAVHQPYQYSYGDHPFRPSQTETSNGGFLDVRRVAGSKRCGTCHTEITKQWQASIHSQAASDKTYQTNVNLLAKKKGMATTRYCEGCHAPVALLSGELTEGGRLDTYGHLYEGVSCMGCHGIDRIEHLKGVASYNFNPKTDYLFAGYDNELARKITNYLIRIQPRQHQADMGRSVLSSPQLCGSCHAQFMDKDVNNWGWVKMQDEYTTWLNSPFSGQSEQSFAVEESKRCHDCHMPLVDAQDPSADKNGKAVSHLTLGANTAIPWLNGDSVHMAKTVDFLQSNKVRVSIEKPNRPDATHSKKFIDPSIFINKETPAYYYLGETVELNVIVSNVGVGHDFPGGTTDINEVWINLHVVDAQNNSVYTSGFINDKNDVDPNAYFYRSLAIDRFGNHVWKHDLFNMVGDSFKKVVRSGESDIVTYQFDVPSWVKSPLSVSAIVKYRKFNNRYARWALQDDSIEIPIVDVARTSLTIPVRMKPEVDQLSLLND
jgi:hypothetical protein